MSEASFASLGPTLLARKGGAKPAMRPQLAPLPETVNPEQLEDLGWNDMGQEEGQDDNGADIVAIKPAAKKSSPQKAANEDALDGALGGDSPLVAREQQRLVEHVLKDAEQTPLVKAKPAAKKKKKKAAIAKAPAKGANSKACAKRAAFTLRLDTDRHLKLRLAATMQGKSAQALVTEALDVMLSEIDDLDALASRMKRN